MGLSFPNPDLQASSPCSKRRCSDLGDGADEPAPKRSRPGQHHQEADMSQHDEDDGVRSNNAAPTTDVTVDAEALDPDPTNQLTHGGCQHADDSSVKIPATDKPSLLDPTCTDDVDNAASKPSLLDPTCIDDVDNAAPKTGPDVWRVPSYRNTLWDRLHPGAPSTTPGYDANIKEDYKHLASRYEWVDQLAEIGPVLVERWEDLVACVGGLVYGSLPDIYSWDKLSSEHQAEISKWAAHAPEHFNSSRIGDASNIFKAWVWHILYEHVFSGQDPDKWNGELWASFGKIQASTEELITDCDEPFNLIFHHWRNLTTRLLGRKDPNQRHIDPLWLECEIEKRLGSIQAEFIKGDPDFDGLEDEDPTSPVSYRRALANAAIEMDELMITTRRRVRMEMYHPVTHEVNGFSLDEKLMRPEALSAWGMEMGTVDYIRCPALVIHGVVGNRYYAEGPESVLFPFGCIYERKEPDGTEVMEVVCHSYPKRATQDDAVNEEVEE